MSRCPASRMDAVNIPYFCDLDFGHPTPEASRQDGREWHRTATGVGFWTDPAPTPPPATLATGTTVLRHGDRVLIGFHAKLDPGEPRIIAEQLMPYFPGVDFSILDNCVDFSILDNCSGIAVYRGGEET